MSAPENGDRLSFSRLESAVQAADPAVLFVEPRILRRVIKQDRRLVGIGFQVPHAHVYTVERERLLIIAERPELDLSPAAELPRSVILLPRAEMDESVAALTMPEALHWYWRQLFHARVHIALEEQLAARRLDEADVEARIRKLGAGAFAEIRNVLVRDDFLPPIHAASAAYVEFAAVALELKHFAPGERQYVFPAVEDWDAVDELLGRDVPHQALYGRVRPEGAPAELCPGPEPSAPAATLPHDERTTLAAAWSPRSIRLLGQAERAARLGNHVRAAILRMRAARYVYPERVRELRLSAELELEHLAARLKAMLQLTDAQTREWLTALAPLLEPAAAGFRRVEARLLYDLQKACVSHERGLYRFSWWRWLRTWGREPLRRALPMLRQVLIAKALRSAANRASTVRLDADDRRRLELLLDQFSDQVEAHCRDLIRPQLAAVLDEVGLAPRNVPERISRRKLVEELLDRVVERGFINLGDLRDSLSQSDLKLPDLGGVAELVLGDPLLRADRELATRLEGVYRPGTVYLRMPQRLSSLAFGTPVGRWLTQYVILPFGGSYLAIEFVLHVVHRVVPQPEAEGGTSSAAPVAPPAQQSNPLESLTFFAWVLLVGALLMLILHRPKFRAALVRGLTRSWKLLRRLLIDWPSELLRAPLVQRVLQSQAWGVLRNYVFRPAVATLIVAAFVRTAGFAWTRNLAIQVFLAADLFLNSPVGRYAEEWLTDVLVRAWHELRIRVIAALFHWIMDVFHQLLQWLERVIYTVDEWLRFRAGDPRSFLAVKLVLGTVWSVIAYVIRICVTLLIEPQVNPIKHFPVVTVSHKILFPYTFALSKVLQPLVGNIWAPTLATTVILLLPGVFGFLVWELKGNWRLYGANRPRSLVPAPVGRHGETVTALLRPGIHSGTLPKLFSKLRQALRDIRRSEHGRAARKQLAALQTVETSLRRFFSRTLCELLSETGFHGGAAPAIGQIRLATNRIDVELRLPEFEAGMWLRFEDLAGWLTASVVSPGWIERLSPSEFAQMNAALAGLYKLAGVELVYEQLDGELGERLALRELTPEGIIVTDRRVPSAVAAYDLSAHSRRVAPRPAEPRANGGWPTLEREQVVFAERPLDWSAWVATWSRADSGNGAPPIEGYPPVLPAVDGRASMPPSVGILTGRSVADPATT